jgi:hypothetical protein
MSDNIELGTLRKLIESCENYSKAVEIAVEIDENDEYTDSDNRNPTEGYKKVIQELLVTKSERDELDSSIYLEVSKDDFEPDREFVHVHLLNNEYEEPNGNGGVIDFDDVRTYKTLAIDFVPRTQLLDKQIEVSRCVIDKIPVGVTIEDFVLGNILWEITFYGFSSADVERKAHELKKASKEASIEIEEIFKDGNFEKYIEKRTGEIL